MSLKKHLSVLLLCVAMISCSSSGGGKNTSVTTNSSDSKNEWVSRVSDLWSYLAQEEFSKDEYGRADASYWLSASEISALLTKNGFFSQVENKDGVWQYSRNFCGEESYPEIIARNIGVSPNGQIRASSTGYRMVGTGEVSEDSIFVAVSMTVFRLNDGVDKDNVGTNIFREIQDQIAAQTSGRCRFIMRQGARNNQSVEVRPEPHLINGWPTESDFACLEKPCLGWSLRDFESVLSKGEGDDFFLLQAPVPDAPNMRTVYFMPRPAESTLLLIETMSRTRNFSNRTLNKKMSLEFATKHTTLAAELSFAWKDKSATFSQLDDLGLLYGKSKPLPANVSAQIENLSGVGTKAMACPQVGNFTLAACSRTGYMRR
jgi:hypothetical protein